MSSKTLAGRDKYKVLRGPFGREQGFPMIELDSVAEEVGELAESEDDPDEDDLDDQSPSVILEMNPLLFENRPDRVDVDEMEIALKFWNSAGHLPIDLFLKEIYEYYQGKGLVPIVLTRIFELLNLIFVTGFFLFLAICIDYSRLMGTTSDWRLLIHLDSLYRNTFAISIWSLLSVFLVFKIYELVVKVPFLFRMRCLFSKLLNVSDSIDLPTIAWSKIVDRIVQLQKEHPLALTEASEQQQVMLDAHVIANYLMRMDNYWIAMINKDVIGTSGDGCWWFTEFTEWNLRIAIDKMIFDDRNHVKSVVLAASQEGELIETLRWRFFILGIIHLFLTPLSLVLLTTYLFIHLGSDLHSNYGRISYRQYSKLARLKFQEFNELPHLLEMRLNESSIYCDEYLNQFPNINASIAARLVVFVSGSVTLLLAILGLLNEDLLVANAGDGRSLIWYLGIFGAVLAASRSLIPDERRVYNPGQLMSWIIEFTHYRPRSWKSILHARTVRDEFQNLYQLRWRLYLNEIQSVLFLPYLFLVRFPAKCARIVRFFRDFTVHVHGIGNICSFAVFDFQRHGDVRYGTPSMTSSATMRGEERRVLAQGKLEKSLLSFQAAYPEWHPTDPYASQLIHRVELSKQRMLQQKMSSIQDERSASLNMGQVSFEPSMILGRQSIEPNIGFVSILNMIYDGDEERRPREE